MAIKLCRVCKRLQPFHRTDCVYAGAVLYANLLNMTLPPDPYTDVPYKVQKSKDADGGELIEQIPDVAAEDMPLFYRLRDAWPQQLTLVVPARVVES